MLNAIWKSQPYCCFCFRYCSVFKVQFSRILLPRQSRYWSFLCLLSCSQESKWWAWEDSNLRPHAYQACALTTWATSPCQFRRRSSFSSSDALWWRWGGSNSWPPACKAGALPTELHPHVSITDWLQGLRNLFLLFSTFWRFTIISDCTL